MRVEVLGTIAVRNGDAAVRGRALGGRRARVVLVALALSGGHLTTDRLADIVWGDDPPPTWPTALRGVVRGLRHACAPVGGGEQQVIATTPSGYRLAEDVEVDVDAAADSARQAAELLSQGRHREVIRVAEPVSRLAGDQLLPGEDGDWLDVHRGAIETTAMRAGQLMIEAYGRLGQHHGAIEAAEGLVAAHPWDESTHRTLIAALDLAGNRAGAIRAYERCRALLADQLGIDPSAATVQVYLRVLREQPGHGAARLPSPTSSFIGREDDVVALARALAHPGLVTVTGTGGVGKSRLALHTASRHGGFAGGRLWVPLASVAQNELVAASVALGLGLPLGAGDPALAVAEHLAPLGRVLLVLDGCEGVVDGVASLASILLAEAPMLTILATSRWPLAVEGERRLVLSPLPMVVPGSDLGSNEQVRLLLDRVREAGGDLSVDASLEPHLIALCLRCGGLPLALELVGAQLAAMPVGDLLDHLDEITSAQEEHLRSIAFSSYSLLADDEAAVFRRLGVLDGPVGLPLVRQVVADELIAPLRVVRILRELTARSLLSVDRSGPRWRYQQDDDLHRFARQLLAEHGEEPITYERLADAIRSRLPDDARATPAPFRDEITDVLDSVRSLFSAALAGRADPERCRELAFRLHRYFATTNVAEGTFWLTRLLEAGVPGPWTPYATFALGYLSYWAGDTDNAMRELETAVALLDGAQDSYQARALIFLAGLLDDVDRGAEAIEQVRRSIEAAAPFDVDLQCSAAMGMGSVLAERVDSAAARYAHDAIELCRAGGSIAQLTIALPTAAMICWQVGALDQARDYVMEALPLNAASGSIARVVLLSAAAGVSLADGNIEAAIDFASTADTEGTGLGVEREMPLVRSILARALLAQHDASRAADCTAAALDAALTMPISFPLAIGLETAALILHVTGAADDGLTGGLIDAAAGLRRRGDRPAPPTLAMAVQDLLVGLDRPSARAAVDAREVARTALVLLAGIGRAAVASASAN